MPADELCKWDMQATSYLRSVRWTQRVSTLFRGHTEHRLVSGLYQYLYLGTGLPLCQICHSGIAVVSRDDAVTTYFGEGDALEHRS